MSSEQNAPLFALDIGTRSVVGLLLRPTEDKFELIDSVVKEHDERAMLDGQIHDVPSVAKVIQFIKECLEERHGPLKKVCVAAAGRSLKTKRSRFNINIETKPMLSRDDLLHLELSAVQNAQFLLANENDGNAPFEYYCVGYSVLNYLLDEEPIGSLLDQIGKQASVEVITTFLPKVVVESLLAALARADLELEALTLEPIAAINVLIPPSMRRLNVALVDIGAGTSDIAITDENTVIAYGMVPIAGDEVTEAISDYFLLDFPEAEKVKREISIKETVQIMDILGLETTYEKSEILEPITETIQDLAHSISKEILKLNGKAPKAVMLVGGGSLTPYLPQFIAEALELPQNRVVIRGADAIKLLKLNDVCLYGPELVTPIGIAIAAKENPIEYISVSVNGRTLRLFDVKTLTVGDGLLAAGINIAKLYGKPGLAIMITVQDQLISIPGKHGAPPTLLKNGNITTLDSPLGPEDNLIVERGTDGKSATVSIKELVDDLPLLTLTINGLEKQFQSKVYLNGKRKSLDTLLNDRDHVTVSQIETVQDLLSSLHVLENFKPYKLTVNKEEWMYQQPDPVIYVNNQPKSLNDKLNNRDQIDWNLNPLKPKIIDLLSSKHIKVRNTIAVFFNHEPITLEKSFVQVYRDHQLLKLEDELLTHDHLTLKTQESQPFILQDIFLVVDLNIESLSGKTLTINKNGDQATFSTPINNGDKIELAVQ
nr:cell division FtsA domain-containing protein [Halalkalibacter alkalisediminis]